MQKKVLLTASEVWQILGYSQSSLPRIYVLAKEGKIPKPVKIGGRRFWSVKDIENFLKEKGVDVKLDEILSKED